MTIASPFGVFAFYNNLYCSNKLKLFIYHPFIFVSVTVACVRTGGNWEGGERRIIPNYLGFKIIKHQQLAVGERRQNLPKNSPEDSRVSGSFFSFLFNCERALLGRQQIAQGASCLFHSAEACEHGWHVDNMTLKTQVENFVRLKY